MKRTAIMLLALFSVVFSIGAFAADYVEITDETVNAEEEFALASIQSTRNFVKNDDDLWGLERTVSWLSDNSDRLNVKYVTVMGDLTNSSVSDYTTHINNGYTMAEFIAISLAEEGWNDEFARLRAAVEALQNAALPFSLVPGIYDYPRVGMQRTNLLATYFSVGMRFPEGSVFELYDECNSYYCFTAGTTDYMVFALEMWPRRPVVGWVNDIIAKNPEKRVILMTPSLIQPTGEITVAADWNIKNQEKIPSLEWSLGEMSAPHITSDLRRANMCWTDDPHDGNLLWDYCIKKNDNIFLVVNSYIDQQGAGAYTGKIVTNTLKNDAGYDVAIVLANAEKKQNTETAVMPLLFRFSNSGEEIEVNYCLIDEGLEKNGSASFRLNLKEVEESAGLLGRPVIKKQSAGTNTAYINGYEDGTFRPQDNMTRAQACSIIERLLRPAGGSGETFVTRFSDVKPEAWYYDSIAFLDHAGVLDAYTLDRYEPEQNITRAEFIDLIYRTNDLTGGWKEVFFYDVDEQDPFYEAIMTCARAGAINGYEDETFRPRNTITRAEVVTIVNRIIGVEGSRQIVGDTEVKVFPDTVGHWAYYNVIMASNSGTVPAYCKDIDTTGISQTKDAIMIENGTVRIAISKQTAHVVEFYDKVNKKDINSNLASRYFCYFFDQNKAMKYPQSASFENNRLCFRFADGATVYFIAQAKESYLSFEVDSYAYATYYGLSFANFSVAYDLKREGAYAVAGVAMNVRANPVYFPDGKNMKTIATSYMQTGINGAKLAVVAAPYALHREIFQQVLRDIEPGAAPVSLGVGGPFAMDNAECAGDYVIISDSRPDVVFPMLEMYLNYGVDQLDFHQGGSTFRQGDFYFHHFGGEASEFKRQVADPLKEQGIVSGLHTYSFYINPGATSLLSDPQWQKDLQIGERYTLAADVGKFATVIKTEESTQNAYTLTGYRAVISEYILIDNEIIRINTGAFGGKEFQNVTRGQCGTVPAEHKAGAKIKRITAYYNGLTPIPGSGLFYEVARLTAKAYNEGGFGMIYFDALDGMIKHVPSEYYWYYTTEFVNAVVKDCVVPPLVEMSSFEAAMWAVRGRAGALDHPTSGYKAWNILHTTSNRTYLDRYIPSIFGWYNLYPVVDFEKYPGNWQVKYHFFDDVEHMASLAVAYNFGMTYNGLTQAQLDKYPALKRNMDLYHSYNTLRKTGYFSEAVKQQVREGKYEYAIVEKSAGVYAFVEKYYAVGKIRNGENPDMDSIKGNNPFTSQQPFIRIEGGYSSKGEDPITIMTFDENKTLNEQKLNVKHTPTIDATDHYALKVKVYGNNSGDALCIRLKGYPTVGVASTEYFVKLDFSGWREFIFVDTDNGDFTAYTFPNRSLGIYELYLWTSDFSLMEEVYIYKSGNCDGVRISSLALVKHTENAITNPTVKVGGQSITFRCVLKSDEYIEYFPGKPALIYDNIGNSRPVDGVDGSLTVPSGDFEAVFSGTNQGNGPSRVRLSFGFTGKEITG